MPSQFGPPASKSKKLKNIRVSTSGCAASVCSRALRAASHASVRPRNSILSSTNVISLFHTYPLEPDDIGDLRLMLAN